jgi:hypothetical protein
LSDAEASVVALRLMFNEALGFSPNRPEAFLEKR